MRIKCVGGGPGGLYFAILAKLRNPAHHVTVLERNASGSTYGWGVVYWDALRGALREHDPVSGRRIGAESVRWVGQQLRVGEAPAVHLGGYGYSIGRHRLLSILERRARELGVEIMFGQEVGSLDDVADADLVVLADGCASRLRDARAHRFGTASQTGRNRFVWLGSNKCFREFTFGFERTDAGWIWFHGYQFSPVASTVIVECSPATWHGLGFATLTPDQGRDRLGAIFERQLDGHELLDQPRAPARWTAFTQLSNQRWHDGNVVLLGDAAHTTHFSIGSGTRLALGDAIALAHALDARPGYRLADALEAYERDRMAVVRGFQRTGALSEAWFEDVGRHFAHDLADVGYSLRMRRTDGVRSQEGLINRGSWSYRAHLATQRRVFRSARRVVSFARRSLPRRSRDDAPSRASSTI